MSRSLDASAVQRICERWERPPPPAFWGWGRGANLRPVRTGRERDLRPVCTEGACVWGEICVRFVLKGGGGEGEEQWVHLRERAGDARREGLAGAGVPAAEGEQQAFELREREVLRAPRGKGLSAARGAGSAPPVAGWGAIRGARGRGAPPAFGGAGGGVAPEARRGRGGRAAARRRTRIRCRWTCGRPPRGEASRTIGAARRRRGPPAFGEGGVRRRQGARWRERRVATAP